MFMVLVCDMPSLAMLHSLWVRVLLLGLVGMLVAPVTIVAFFGPYQGRDLNSTVVLSTTKSFHPTQDLHLPIFLPKTPLNIENIL